MQKPLRLGIVGVGKLGEVHAKLLSELSSERKDVVFVGVYDKNPARSAEIARRFGTRAFASLAECAQSVDAAIVATTTSAHFEVASALMRCGVHLLIEKPMTATLERS
ncbi:MAG: Gfo/Idh/MocA family oxidoreductase [Chloroherpetonaceae bacterium]|nr:Gfo/Idh/MocA family oxidoreductase [Chloroherpetonaceae bacterium]